MIEIKDMFFKYAGGGEQVFRNFSLQLQANNIYGLLGKNGTGKSTLLYLIDGLLRPQEGTVTVDGVVSSRRLPQTLSEIFLVPEEFDLPSVTLDEYIRLNAPFYPRFSREVLKECLNDFDLDDQLHLGKLSMGQKKKVFMSFALSANTQLLLMDEPTNGLDIPSKSQFRRVVANHMSDDRMVIISTHQVHDVEQLLDHVLILSESQLMLNASVAELCDKYVFEERAAGADDKDVVYAEPSVHGQSVVARRKAEMAETSLNLELLFNATVTGAIV